MLIKLPKDIFQFSFSFSPIKRALIRVKGVDASKFLHGLCTNNIQKLADDPDLKGFPALFLNPIGRILYDTFIFKRTSEDYFIDCDPRVDKDLISHLLIYRLRNRVEIATASDWRLLLSWKFSWCETVKDAINIDDLRCSWPLKRTLIPVNEPLINEEDCQDQEWYDALRMYYGIAEGPIEIIRNKAIAHEYNFDIMNVIDFQKGCYVGQEFIMRTEKSGIIRKRILPFIMVNEKDSITNQEGNVESQGETKEAKEEKEMLLTKEKEGFEGISHGTEVMNLHESMEKGENGNVVNLKSDNVIGKFICMNGNMGLAMIRLDRWNRRNIPYYIHRPDPSSMENYLAMQPFIPEWWPAKVT